MRDGITVTQFAWAWSAFTPRYMTPPGEDKGIWSNQLIYVVLIGGALVILLSIIHYLRMRRARLGEPELAQGDGPQATYKANLFMTSLRFVLAVCLVLGAFFAIPDVVRDIFRPSCIIPPMGAGLFFLLLIGSYMGTAIIIAAWLAGQDPAFCCTGFAVKNQTLYIHRVVGKTHILISSIQSIIMVRDHHGHPRLLKIETKRLTLDLFQLPGIRRLAHTMDTEWIDLQPAGAPSENGESLESLAQFFRHRHVQVEDNQLSIPARDYMPPLFFFGDFLLGVATVVLSFMVCMAILFWCDWVWDGSIDFALLQYDIFWVAPTLWVLLYLVGPVRSWFWKSIDLFEKKNSRRTKGYPVFLHDGLARLFLLGYAGQQGHVTFDNDRLLLAGKTGSWLIGRDQVLELSKIPGLRSLYKTSEACRIAGTRFIRNRPKLKPVVLRWRSEDGYIKFMLLNSRGGASFHQDNKTDHCLFDILCRWRSGEKPAAELNELPISRRFRAPLLCALVIFCSLVLGLAHNFVVWNYVRTNRLKPPVSGPVSKATFAYSGIQAVGGSHVVFQEASENNSTASRWWGLDLHAKSWNFLGFNLEGLRSTPLPPDYYIPDIDIFSLCMAKITVHLPAHDRIISVNNGSTLETQNIPAGIGFWDATVYKNEKIFWVKQRESYAGKSGQYRALPRRIYSPQELRRFLRKMDNHSPGWDKTGAEYNVSPQLGRMYLRNLQTGHRQALGTIGFLTSPAPVFFPGGRFVLCGWSIVDLSTGAVKALRLPRDPASVENLFLRLNTVFCSGNRLRLPTCCVDRSELINEVWEIDPVTGRVDIIERLAPNEFLLSADGERWLLAVIRKWGDIGLELYSRDRGMRKELFSMRENSWYSLIAGKDLLFVTEKDRSSTLGFDLNMFDYTVPDFEGNGWEIRKF